MEFDTKDKDDVDRRLAETKAVTIQPLHESITLEEPPEAEQAARENTTQPVANTANDHEQTVASPRQLLPTQSALAGATASESTKHFLAVFFFSFLWGSFGVDRFYLGKIGTGILKLITGGGFGLWTIIDLVIIMSGAMRDKAGLPLAGYAQYKKLAIKTVVIFAIASGLVILISGASLIALGVAVANQLMNNPDLQQLNGLNGTDLTQLGL